VATSPAASHPKRTGSSELPHTTNSYLSAYLSKPFMIRTSGLSVKLLCQGGGGGPEIKA